MKKITALLFGLALIFTMSGAAAASPWVDTIDEPYFIDWYQSYHYTHDITYDGFVPGTDLVTDYVLTIGLYDDNDRWDEIALVNQPGLIADGVYNFNYENQEFGFSLAGLVQLNLFGELDVTISSLFGDFWFGSSVLTATGINNSAPVPEPATLLLLGAGMLGLVGVSRKKFRK